MTILLFQNSPVQYPVVWIVSGFAIAVAVIQRLSKWAKQKNDFLNDKRERIKEIPVDARLFKFVRSLELSKQGQQLAGRQPYLIRSGPYHELVISQPDHIQDFYEHDAKRHEKPKNFNLGHLFGRLAGDAVGAQNGDDWRKIRKHFDPPFAFHPTMQNKSRFDVEIRQWIEGLTPSARNEVNSAVSFEILTFRLLALHLYGDAFDDRIYWRMLELNDMHEGVIRSLLTSRWPDSKLWNMLLNAANRQLSKFLSQWKDFNAMIIEHARGGRWNCPVEVIYSGVNPDNEITEEQFLSTLDEILFTNVDVSAGVLSTIFTRLASSPSIPNALRDEIKLWKGRLDLGEAKYLAKSDTLSNRVIMESMRISPAFWFSMPESTARPKKIGGYLIPANTTVVIDTRRLNNEAITRGNDSADFNPDRFLKLPQEKLRCGFMRFETGAASGRCLGKNVADVLFKLTTIAIVERFSLESLSIGEKVGRSKSDDIRICRL